VSISSLDGSEVLNISGSLSRSNILNRFPIDPNLFPCRCQGWASQMPFVATRFCKRCQQLRQVPCEWRQRSQNSAMRNWYSKRRKRTCFHWTIVRCVYYQQIRGRRIHQPYIILHCPSNFAPAMVSGGCKLTPVELFTYCCLGFMTIILSALSGYLAPGGGVDWSK